MGSLPQELQPAHTNIRMIFILQALVLHSMVWVPARSCQTFMWYAMCMNSGLPMKGRHSISGIAIRMAFLPIRCAMGLMLFRLVSMMLIMISIFPRSGIMKMALWRQIICMQWYTVPLRVREISSGEMQSIRQSVR